MPSDRWIIDPEPQVVLFRTAGHSKKGIPVSELDGRRRCGGNQLYALTIPTSRLGLGAGQNGHATPRVKDLYRYYFNKLSMIPDEKQYLVVEQESETAVGV